MNDNNSEKTKRIAKNTGLLYMRSLVSLFISLYTSRLVLKGLGADDIGLYSVVGGFVSMFSIVTSSLSGAISRFLNFSMGKGDPEEQTNVFAMSVNIMILLSLIVLILTESFGIWYLYHRMNIPPGRETAAFWCFQFSVLASISGFLTVPFTSSIIAHERMGVFAYVDIAEVILKFIIALLLTFSLGDLDKLVFYAACLLLIALSKQMFSRIYAMKSFVECKIRWFWDRVLFIDLFRYAGWSFVGKTSGTFAGQGVNMVINVVFGPAVNAARHFSWTVNNSVGIFVNNFTMAINPQVTQSYAAGDYAYMKSLLIRGTKFTFYILWMMFLPLFLETKFVVDLWLGEYPDHTVNFIRLALIWNTINILQVVLAMGIRATGKITAYQLSFSALEFVLFGLTYIMLHNGYAPEWCYISGIIIAIVKVFIMWIISKRQLGISIWDYVKNAVYPILLVTVVSAIIPFFIHFSMPETWIRFILVLVISILLSLLSILFIGCNEQERHQLISMVLSRLKRS